MTTATESKSSAADAASKARSQFRVEQIVDAATELMHENGSRSVSMQAIAKTAGVSVGLLYKYFGSKEEILLAAIERVLGAFETRVPKAIEEIGEPVERIKVAFAEFCRSVDDHRRAVVLTYRESRALSPAGLERVKTQEISTLRPLIDAVTGARDGGLLETEDPELFAHNLLMLAHAWALKYWHHAGRGMDVDDYVRLQTNSLINPSVVTT